VSFDINCGTDCARGTDVIDVTSDGTCDVNVNVIVIGYMSMQMITGWMHAVNAVL